MAELSARQPRGRDLLIGIAGALIAAAALVAGIGRLAGFSDLRRALGEADAGWLSLCVAGQVVVFGGYAGALRRAMASEGGPWIEIGVVVPLVLASFAASQVFAFGGVAGLAIVYWAFRRVGLERQEAITRVIGLNTAVYLTFGAIGWCAALWALVADEAPLGMTLPWLLGLPVVLLAAIWFTAPMRVAHWTAPSERLLRRALAVGVGAAAWVRRSLASPDGRRLFPWAIAYWVGDIASLWAALRAFNATPPLPAIVLAYTTGYLAQSLPIPLIATSGLDAATTFLLNAIGLPLELALLGVVTHRVFAFWVPVIPGSILALSMPRIGRSLSTAARVPSDIARPVPG